LLDAHPEVGFAYGRCIVWQDDQPRPAAHDGGTRWKIWPGRSWLERRCRTAENCIYCPEVVVRTSLLRRLGGYRRELPHTADFELWMRLAIYADVGFVQGPPQAYYRVHAGSMGHERFGTALADLRQAAAAFETLFRDHGGALVDRGRLEGMARRMLRKRFLLAACRAYDFGESSLADVEAFERLAASIDPDGYAGAEERGLRWRKRLGPWASRLLWPLLPPTVVLRLARRGRRELSRRFGL
jgi:hypothetical protein